MPAPAVDRGDIATLVHLLGQPEAGESFQAGAVLQAVGSTQLPTQDQSVQCGAAASFEVRFTPHARFLLSATPADKGDGAVAFVPMPLRA